MKDKIRATYRNSGDDSVKRETEVILSRHRDSFPLRLYLHFLSICFSLHFFSLKGQKLYFYMFFFLFLLLNATEFSFRQ